MITDNPDVYKKNLKAMSDIDPLYNMCMECGFCERNCPSRNLTLTPRQRISLLREEQRLLKEGNTAMAEELKKAMITMVLIPVLLVPCVPCFVL